MTSRRGARSEVARRISGVVGIDEVEAARYALHPFLKPGDVFRVLARLQLGAN